MLKIISPFDAWPSFLKAIFALLHNIFSNHTLIFSDFGEFYVIQVKYENQNKKFHIKLTVRILN